MVKNKRRFFTASLALVMILALTACGSANNVTQASEKNKARLEFEASERFQERIKIRHRIEEKNGELKEAHGLRRADSTGLFAMELQTYFTAFVVNIKRITKLAALNMQ